MKIMQNIFILIAMPLFLLGATGIAQNLFDGNLVPTLIGVGLVVLSFILFGLGLFLNKATEILTDNTMGSARQRLHHKIYEMLVNNGYDSNVAFDIATRVVNIYKIK